MHGQMGNGNKCKPLKINAPSDSVCWSHPLGNPADAALGGPFYVVFMGNDPAFLFYPGDWLGGTILMSRAHKGAYMDLLMAQFNLGHLAECDIQTILGKDYESLWEGRLKAKFKLDDNGLYYNLRLDLEIQKRRSFTASRLKNLKSHVGSHMDDHMENRNRNKDIDINNKGVIRGNFEPPTLDECKKEFEEKGYSSLEAEKFFNHYEARGWMMGKNRMKKWRSAVATWITQGKQFGTLQKQKAKVAPTPAAIKPAELEIILSDQERRELIESAMPGYTKKLVTRKL